MAKSKPKKSDQSDSSDPSDLSDQNWAYCSVCGGFLQRAEEGWEHTGQRVEHEAIPQ